MTRALQTNLSWKKSSYSGDQGSCVEVAYPNGGVTARDSKDPNGGMLVFDRAAWAAFLTTTRHGTLDRH